MYIVMNSVINKIYSGAELKSGEDNKCKNSQFFHFICMTQSEPTGPSTAFQNSKRRFFEKKNKKCLTCRRKKLASNVGRNI